MGRSIAEASPAAQQTFEEANDALGFDLRDLCFNGDEATLKQTEITQPAILATSIATWRALRAARPDLAIEAVAGHSLGEWSACVAAGALSFADAIKLVRLRGKLMQAAVPAGEGAMAAIIGLDADKVESICVETCAAGDQVVSPANFNAPDQTVISGAAAAVQAAGEAAKTAGAKRVMPLAVSAPFHSPLMEPAARGLAEALATTEVAPPSAPIVANVDATANRFAERVKPLLIEQVTAPVRWVECTRALLACGVTTAIEVGPGKVLMGLARKIDRSLKVHPTPEWDALQKALEAVE